MNHIGSSLDAMEVEQYLFAFVFLMSYSVALSRWMGPRARGTAAAAALAAAGGLAAVSDPLEQGVLVMAGAVVAVGAMSAAAWLLCAVAERRHAVPMAVEPQAELETTTTSPRPAAVGPRQTGVAST
jgi:hypothetical protein